MTNPVNNPKSSSGNQAPVAKAEISTNEKPSNEPTSVQSPQSTEVSTQVLHPQIVQSKSANTVFERLDEGLKMREQFNIAKDRVIEFENFYKNYDNSGLIMTIRQRSDNSEINSQHVPIILGYIEKELVQKGKEHIKKMESAIINFTI